MGFTKSTQIINLDIFYLSPPFKGHSKFSKKISLSKMSSIKHIGHHDCGGSHSDNNDEYNNSYEGSFSYIKANFNM